MTRDYSEIRGTPDDPMHVLRAFCRGEQAGSARASCSDVVASVLEAKVIAALSAIGLGPDVRQMFLDVAQSDVAVWAPELDAVERRAVAAGLVLDHLRRWVARERRNRRNGHSQ